MRGGSQELKCLTPVLGSVCGLVAGQLMAEASTDQVDAVVADVGRDDLPVEHEEEIERDMDLTPSPSECEDLGARSSEGFAEDGGDPVAEFVTLVSAKSRD